MTIANIDPLASGASNTSGTNTNGTNNTSGTGGSSSTGSSSASSSNEVSQLANPQLFLKLLIAELQNQDPTNPMDPSAILQQTSELSNVEAVTSMTNEMSSQQATGLIGRQVTASVNGAPLTGTVSAINLSSTGQPTLSLTGSSTPISMSAITQVA